MTKCGGLISTGLEPRRPKHASQRAGQQGRQHDQFGDGAGQQDDQHHEAELSRGDKRAEREDGQADAADQGGLQRRRCTAPVGGQNRGAAVARSVSGLRETTSDSESYRRQRRPARCWPTSSSRCRPAAPTIPSRRTRSAPARHWAASQPGPAGMLRATSINSGVIEMKDQNVPSIRLSSSARWAL